MCHRYGFSYRWKSVLLFSYLGWESAFYATRLLPRVLQALGGRDHV